MIVFFLCEENGMKCDDMMVGVVDMLVIEYGCWLLFDLGDVCDCWIVVDVLWVLLCECFEVLVFVMCVVDEYGCLCLDVGEFGLIDIIWLICVVEWVDW